MPRVFVTCHSAANLEKAAKFGEVVKLYDLVQARPSDHRLSLAPARIFTKVAQNINSSTPDDIFLLDGPAVYSAVVVAMAATISQRVTFLIYNHDAANFVKRTLYFPVAKCRKPIEDQKPRVFAATDSHDMSRAKSFGEITTLIPSSEGIPAYNTRKIAKLVVAPLKDSQPQDHLLLAGEKSINAIAAAVLARRHGKLNLLLIHHTKGVYLAKTVDISRERIRELAN
jgi:hypothetical protein